MVAKICSNIDVVIKSNKIDKLFVTMMIMIMMKILFLDVSKPLYRVY